MESLRHKTNRENKANADRIYSIRSLISLTLSLCEFTATGVKLIEFGFITGGKKRKGKQCLVFVKAKCPREIQIETSMTQ